jgi:hypothetical protein
MAATALCSHTAAGVLRAIFNSDMGAGPQTVKLALGSDIAQLDEAKPFPVS